MGSKRVQQEFFFADAPPWEIEDQADVLVAEVAFPSGPPGLLSYRVPDPLRDSLRTGMRVRVPLGASHRLRWGFCVRLGQPEHLPSTLKDVQQVMDEERLVSPEILRLTEWMSEYYLCRWGQVLQAVVPAGVRGQAGTRSITYLSLASDDAENNAKKAPPTQDAVLRYLTTHGVPVPLAQVRRDLGCSDGPIRALRKKGLVTTEIRRSSAEDISETPVKKVTPPLDLNEDQRQALEAIHAALHAAEHQTILVHGVTGSGKTEVYMRAIAEVISFGRQAILLVPEISLTPQTVERFRHRFGRVAVLHSHLSDTERHAQWRSIASGAVSVVIGARSAVFAPTKHLGMIVLDEEHESSFKQNTAPRYHARDVAVERARAANVPLILGSATPSLESWHAAKKSRYRLVSLPRRVLDRPLPAVRVVDLRLEQERRGHGGVISRYLHQAALDVLRRGEQVILLLNRRGFATHIQCPSCGEVVSCPNCDIALTHHRAGEIALCHYCEHAEPAPKICPNCRSPGIRYRGLGTQRVEMEVKARFPDYTCFRMDTDSMRGPGSHERALAKFRQGDYHILLGTQMIAKGLDFPQVTLVGVVNADTALHLPDFRAGERTFQLVTQVAGRTGRGDKGGHVIVQTYSPDHPAIAAAAAHDYLSFAEHELPLREEYGYPPYGHVARAVAKGPQEESARSFAEALGELLRKGVDDSGAAVRILGPAPAPLARLRGDYRFHLQLHAEDVGHLQTVLCSAIDQLTPPKDVQWMVDIDPVDLL